jgi:hypothetical protein
MYDTPLSSWPPLTQETTAMPGIFLSTILACIRKPAHCAAPDLPLDGEPAPGAHLVTCRPGYEHHGIYVGAGRVVHYAGFACLQRRGSVEETTLERFSAGHPVIVRSHAMARFTGDEAVRRARSRLGENRYRLLTNNCEHLCAWVVSGENRSTQVEACLVHPRLACRVAMRMARGAIEARSRDGLVAM